MTIKIAGKIQNSFVDYPGMIATVVFTCGCNLNCYYCHNRGIINVKGCTVLYSPDFVLKELFERKGFIDALVISGGEPTLQSGLAEFIGAAKSEGFLTKLDTNGTRPDVVEKLLQSQLLDYVAMDVKAPVSKYGRITLSNVDIDAIRRSIDVIKSSGVRYEFRTTFAPVLTPQDIQSIARDLIPGAEMYVINQYKPSPEQPEYVSNSAPHTKAELLHAAELARLHVRQCTARGYS